MNEAETRAAHVDPVLAAAGWGSVEGSRIRREYPITLGRMCYPQKTVQIQRSRFFGATGSLPLNSAARSAIVFISSCMKLLAVSS
jgi:hypothetical protein